MGRGSNTFQLDATRDFGYTATNRRRWVDHMYYGIGLGGLIVLVVILLFLF